MLSREENRWNFKFLKFYSDWNLLPISVDEKSGRISRQEKRQKLYIWCFIYGLEMSHSFYGLIRLIQLILSPNVNQMMDHLFIHTLALPYILFPFWSYQLFIERPRETVLLFNQLFEWKNESCKKKNCVVFKVITLFMMYLLSP